MVSTNSAKLLDDRELLKIQKDIKPVKLFTEIAEAVFGVVNLMETNNMEDYRRSSNVHSLTYKEVQDGAHFNLEAHRSLYIKMVRDLRVRSLLTEQVEDKKRCFEIVKKYCTPLSEFTVPIYYLERIYQNYHTIIKEYPPDEVSDYMVTIESVSPA